MRKNHPIILKINILILYLLVCLLSVTHASPQFNKVNDLDIYGQKCKLPTYYSYPCPELCVRDISMCPTNNRPSCPVGKILCVDGSCRETCSDSLTSVCACPGAPELVGKVYSCGSNTLYTNIEGFIVEEKVNQSAAACSQAAGLSNIPSWTSNPQSAMWHQCPTPDYGKVTFTEPVFISLYTFYGSCLLVLGLWSIYKKSKERLVKSKFKNQNEEHYVEEYIDTKEKEEFTGTSSIDSESNISVNEDTDNMVIHAYRLDIVGNIAFGLFIIQTLGQIAFMIMMTANYYSNHSYFRGSGEVQSSTFIGMYYIYFFWFAGIAVFRHRLLNFFRLRCDYDQGQYVQVERAEPAMIFLQDQTDAVMDFVRYLEKTAKHMIGTDIMVTILPLKKTSNGTKYFIYQCTRYVYSPEMDQFRPHKFHLGTTHSELANLVDGLSTQEANSREELVGPNFIEVYVPNFVVALFQEFSSFFYIYQFTVLWLFYYLDYWQVGIADTAVIIVSALVKVIIRLRSERRIKKMAEFTDTVNILRDSKWQTKSTTDLLPGDVFEICEDKTAPCDGVVLSGNIVADESSLTGEPLPIRKFPLQKDDKHTIYDKLGSSKISTIFAGTTICQAEASEKNSKATVLVTNTGTATDKGELIKKILFPTRVSFIFNEQIKIVILILLCCSLLILCLGIWMYARGTSAWFYSMFAICQLISPLLPAALVVGQSVAAGHLKKKKIFCVDLPRILMAGKVQLFCFDKTGTLTKDGLEFYGVQCTHHTDFSSKDNIIAEFDNHELNIENIPKIMEIGLATCHAVTTLNDQFIGNPVDIEMFKSSKWTLSPSSDYIDTLLPSNQKTPFHILKRFEFVHARMSMSVAVLDPSTNKIHIFVKGAYEKIKELANPRSIPGNYDHVTSNLAREGCYVLALAHREIELPKDMNDLKALTREEMEANVDFLGLIIFKNQLKEDTADSIAALKQGDTRTVMITGDTALTGVYIARQCGMIATSKVLLGELEGNLLCWSDVDEPTSKSKNIDVDDYLRKNEGVELAVTGKAFEWLVRTGLIRKYLLDIRVFARMTPKGKVQCVQLHMERGITAMTGDGGNDCGALRAAHVGIAMSEAEASIVSPFSTSIRSVRSCVELLRQGRGALATSLTCYKYLILYGQVMMMMKIFSFYFNISLSENIWIAVDVFITVLLTWAVSQSKAAKELAPQRPTARLLGPQTLASGIGLVVINWVFLIAAFVMLFKQEWFRCNEFDSRAIDVSKWMLLADNYEGEVLAFVCVFQFINNAAVFNFGYKFRKSFWRNYILVFLWLLYIAIASYWILADPNSFGCLFRFNCGTKEVLEQIGYTPPNLYIVPYNTPLGHNVLPSSFRWELWGLILGNMFTALAYEKFVVLGPVHSFLAKKYPVTRLKKTL